jgi:hypothetical protein
MFDRFLEVGGWGVVGGARSKGRRFEPLTDAVVERVPFE